MHKPLFQEMVRSFFDLYYKWIPIVHQESFRERWNPPQSDTPRGLAELTLSMCLLTRPFMDAGKRDRLGDLLYVALKRLFWVPESTTRPSLSLIQSGVILSFYEYAHGMFDTAYMTIGVCSSMAHVCGFSTTYRPLRFPNPGPWTQEEENLRTWWAILIHERCVYI